MQLTKFFKAGPFYNCSGDERRLCSATKGKNVSPCSSFPLAFADEREKLTIISLQGGGRMQERLLSMGLCLGDEIEVIQRQNGGAVLIEKRGNRYALGGGMALKIQVIRVRDGKGIS